MNIPLYLTQEEMLSTSCKVGDNMAGAKAIKQLLIERKMTVKSLAEKLGIEPQSMRNKLYRDTFTHAEII